MSTPGVDVSSSVRPCLSAYLSVCLGGHHSSQDVSTLSPSPLSTLPSTSPVLGVYGGCDQYHGAPALCSLAARALGVCSVIHASGKAVPIQALTPQSEVHLVTSTDASSVYTDRDRETPITSQDSRPRIHDAKSPCCTPPPLGAVCIGTGLGRDIHGLVLFLMGCREAQRHNVPLILDGDALWHLAQLCSLPDVSDVPAVSAVGSETEGEADHDSMYTHPLRSDVVHSLSQTEVVLTPNWPELNRLSMACLGRKASNPNTPMDAETVGESGPYTSDCEDLSRQLGCTVLQKGPVDIVCHRGTVIGYLDSPSAPVRCAGQGDVLAGLVGSMAAQRHILLLQKHREETPKDGKGYVATPGPLSAQDAEVTAVPSLPDVTLMACHLMRATASRVADRMGIGMIASDIPPQIEREVANLVKGV
ncbi:ATP-dependent (S)-NAD(P)H-hydrate dehydratase [Kipferlia bialata]|uniref:ATP-dependent (S)-NAD(P)H-hydrate dehydratase n=1 Tax=Kipferlia bialata TaxID=797122 RepID=A0A9K3D102_9EUKA|nr:ATP-dependent (S)-NAD(P)H-hydrate dehydratase [Kipferlia bialata]|eukprot:g7967.t1